MGNGRSPHAVGTNFSGLLGTFSRYELALGAGSFGLGVGFGNTTGLGIVSDINRF